MYNIYQDLNDFFFVPVLLDNGQYYGILVFHQNMPSRNLIDGILARCSRPDNPDWTVNELVRELFQMGYKVGLTLRDEPIFLP